MVRMISVAAKGHRDLCLGQGEELNWKKRIESISVEKVLDIFRRKTSPAFEVALVLGAVFGGANGQLCTILKNFSEALGVAYQIRDDIEDFQRDERDSDMYAVRPSLLLALALENANGKTRQLLSLINRRGEKPGDSQYIKTVISELRLEEKAWQMFDQYKNEALRSLEPLRNSELKSLLFRIVYKILGKPIIKRIVENDDTKQETGIHTANQLSPDEERFVSKNAG